MKTLSGNKESFRALTVAELSTVKGGKKKLKKAKKEKKNKTNSGVIDDTPILGGVAIGGEGGKWMGKF